MMGLFLLVSSTYRSLTHPHFDLFPYFPPVEIPPHRNTLFVDDRHSPHRPIYPPSEMAPSPLPLSPSFPIFSFSNEETQYLYIHQRGNNNKWSIYGLAADMIIRWITYILFFSPPPSDSSLPLPPLFFSHSFDSSESPSSIHLPSFPHVLPFLPPRLSLLPNFSQF